jgi:arsenate reductase
MDAVVWFNPACSKCRGIQALLDDKDISAEFRHYLVEPPTTLELEELLKKLGTEDPMALMRTTEAEFSELGVAELSREAQIQAIVENPILLTRPILVMGDQAVVARPADRALEILP